MEVTAILCNHAEVQNNLLYIAGGGIDRVNVTPGAPPPWNVSLALALQITVPWTQTNQQHVVSVDLLDADWRPVELPPGPGGATTFHAEITVNVGRPPGLQIGDAQSVSAAINVPGLPLSATGTYSFSIGIDGTELQRLGFRVASA